jgi:hydrogenase nickel incorporation protein HypA/HybF
VHEYSIVSALIGQVAEHAAKHEEAVVTIVEVRVGDLAGVEIPLLESAWTLFREGTPCATAALLIRREPARYACRACEAEVPAGARLRCPACGHPAALVSGDALLLERIEMEVEEDV